MAPPNKRKGSMSLAKALNLTRQEVAAEKKQKNKVGTATAGPSSSQASPSQIPGLTATAPEDDNGDDDDEDDFYEPPVDLPPLTEPPVMSGGLGVPSSSQAVPSSSQPAPPSSVAPSSLAGGSSLSTPTGVGKARKGARTSLTPKSVAKMNAGKKGRQGAENSVVPLQYGTSSTTSTIDYHDAEGNLLLTLPFDGTQGADGSILNNLLTEAAELTTPPSTEFSEEEMDAVDLQMAHLRHPALVQANGEVRQRNNLTVAQLPRDAAGRIQAKADNEPDATPTAMALKRQATHFRKLSAGFAAQAKAYDKEADRASNTGTPIRVNTTYNDIGMGSGEGSTQKISYRDHKDWCLVEFRYLQTVAEKLRRQLAPAAVYIRSMDEAFQRRENRMVALIHLLQTLMANTSNVFATINLEEDEGEEE
ncbi:MAG: hypothetical protein M4579_007138 [Chaenotheca gracillima]|nr:MAG: hypothetical protein M4579_007138 [Chaenotheca gracillima]